jgi:hypothetical protein
LKNVYLFQPQYAVDVRNEINYYFPYSAGCVWSYVAQFPDVTEHFRLADIIFRRESVDEILNRLDNPAICGFSCYVWNERWCLAVAEAIKHKWPNCVVVFGGPQTHGGMTSHKFIDVFVRGEGEENFLDLLRTIIAGQEPDLFYSKRRLENLDIPSPYTTGVFDEIIKNNPGAVWAMTLETNRGCPYSCTFCDWGSLTYSKVKKFGLEKVQQELEWIVGQPVRYIVCADANMGIFKERDLEIARMVRAVADQGKFLEGCNFQYAKNSTEVVFQIAQTIGTLGRGVTISVQSMFEDTLDAIKRKNMDVNNMRRLLDLSIEYGVPTYTELILGMPNETLETWINGFDELLEIGQHSLIDMWFTQVLINSEMSQPDYRSKYGITTVVARDYMPLFNPNDCREIEETIELINSTNTMSTTDMVKAYMFGWTVLYFHIGGYSQVVSRYLRSAKNISYKDFYLKLFESLPDDPVFGEHFSKTKEVVHHYLLTGDILPFADIRNGGHALHSASYGYMYERADQAYKLSIAVGRQLADIPSWVEELQSDFVYQVGRQYPLTIKGDCNILTQLQGDTIYTVTPQHNITSEFNFYQTRRKGLLKNLITTKEVQ